MKTSLLAAFALASCIAIPHADAQNYHNWHNYPYNGVAPLSQTQINTIRYDQAWINDMQARINRGVQSGRLTSFEANRLQLRLNNIQNMETRMSVAGLSPHDRGKLADAIEKENQAISRDLHSGEFVGTNYFSRWHHY